MQRIRNDKVGRLVGVVFALALSMTGSRPARAQAGGVPEIASRWSLGGRPRPAQVATADGRVFVSIGSHGASPNLRWIDALDDSGPDGGGGGHGALVVPGRPRGIALVRSRVLDRATGRHENRERLYVASTANDAEVVVVAVPPGVPGAVERLIDLPGRANALCLASESDQVWVGRARSAAEAELVAIDRAGAIVGALDLPRSILHLEIIGGLLLASARRVTFGIDIADPAHPRLVSVVMRAAPAEPPLRVEKTIDFAIDGPMAYLVVEQEGEELQQVNLRKGFDFPDVDRDGKWTLACLGDSNTAPDVAGTRWCETLPRLFDDDRFAIVNLAAFGATAVPSINSTYAQVELALDPSRHVDAAILAIGTNDTNLANFLPDPARFEAQIANVVDHIEAQYRALEARGVKAYVATLPPRVRMLFGAEGRNGRILALNDAIRARFPARNVIEHYDYFSADSSEMADGLHLNRRGQNKRAWRAFQVLSR